MKLLIKVPNRNNVASFIIVLFYVFRLMTYVVGNSFFFYVGSVIGFSSFLLIRKIEPREKRPIFFLLMLYLLMWLTNIYTKNLSLLGMIFNLQYVGLSIILLRCKLNFNLIRLSFFGHVLFFLYHIVIGSNPNLIYIGASRNIISVTMLIQTILLYVSYRANSKQFSIVPALFYLVVSVWAMGRSGIISASMVVFGALLSSFNKTSREKSIAILLSVFLVILILLIFEPNTSLLGPFSDIFMNSIGRLQKQGFESNSRLVIANDYLSMMNDSVMSVFLGVPLYNSKVLGDYDFNIHNSYLTAHAYYGIIGMILIYLSVFRTLVNYTLSMDIMFVFLFASIMIRIFTDIIAFPGFVDPIIYYFMFCKTKAPNEATI